MWSDGDYNPEYDDEDNAYVKLEDHLKEIKALKDGSEAIQEKHELLSNYIKESGLDQSFLNWYNSNHEPKG